MKLYFRRLIAYIIDYSIIFVLFKIFTFSANVFLLKSQTSSEAMYMYASLLVSIFLLCIYIPVKSNGRTVGKMITSLQVKNKDGHPRTFYQSFLRELVLKFSLGIVFFPISLIYHCIVNIVINRDVLGELPHDSFLKTIVE